MDDALKHDIRNALRARRYKAYLQQHPELKPQIKAVIEALDSGPVSPLSDFLVKAMKQAAIEYYELD